MTLSRVLGSRPQVIPLAVGLLVMVCLSATVGWAQLSSPESSRPPKPSGVERDRRIADRDRMREEVDKLARDGKLNEAVALARKELAVTRELQGDLHDDVVGSLRVLAKLQQLRKEWAASRAALEEVITVRERQPDRKRWRVADARRALADLDRYAAMAPDQRLRWDQAERLNSAVEALYAQGKFGEALKAAQVAVRMSREIPGANHHGYTTALNNLARLYRAMGDHRRAKELYIELVAVAQKVLGTDHPGYAAALNNLALLYQDTGEYRRAEELYLESLAVRKKALGADHPDYVSEFNNLATLYHTTGEYRRAEELYLESLAVRKKALVVDQPDYAKGLNNLAMLYRDTGDYRRAAPLLREAVTVAQKALGADHPDYANYLNNLAMVLEAMGDYPRAKELYLESLAVRKKALVVNQPDYAKGLNNLALLYRATGDYRRAAPLLREAVAVAKGANDIVYAALLTNLALVYQATGDYRRAEELYVEALALRKKALGANHPHYANSLINLATLCRDTGDYRRAEEFYSEALAVSKMALGADHPDYANSLINLALLHWAAGDNLRAELTLHNALEITARFTRNLCAAVGERQRLLLLRNHRGNIDAYISIAIDAGVKQADLYRCVYEWKGAGSNQSAEDRLTRDQQKLAPSIVLLDQVRARYANLAFSNPTQDQRPAWRQQLKDLGAQKDDLEADLAAQSATFRRNQQIWQVGPDEVALALPDGAALVDIISYNHYIKPEGAKGPFRGQARLLAFVIRPRRPMAVVSLGEARPVTEAAVAYRRAVLARQPDVLQKAAAELGRRIWDPLKPHLTGVRTVLIAPDGGLTLFPFAALPGSRPGSYLIEDLSIGYVASARQLVEARDDLNGPAGRGLLAIGDVDFQADPGRATPPPPGRSATVAHAEGHRAGFRPLPATRPEARRAREIFHTSFPDQPTELLTGSEPTEAELKRLLNGNHWRVVHLATHGFFEPPGRVAALRASVGRDDPFAMTLDVEKAGDDALTFELTPLLHSGVVLAGGGRSPEVGSAEPFADAPPREDGILTADEVQVLDLRGCELVVLSACDTGRGKVEGGQGVLGLQRAFQAAGARAVVASLWKVDDAATAVLMKRFYTNLWKRNLPKVEALRQAQLDILNDPGLVERSRAELERGLGPKPVKLHNGGLVPPPPGLAMRAEPAFWAAFLLSGATR